ncbi:hydrolase [Alishewanella longhuensis]
MLPAFYHELKAEQRFTAAWQSQTQQDIRLWRQNAAIVRNALLWPEHAIGFAPELIASEPRNGYRAERWLITLTPGNRVPVLLLRPAGEGPFGAVLLLHDRGAISLLVKKR